jgi:hypothetical protein
MSSCFRGRPSRLIIIASSTPLLLPRKEVVTVIPKFAIACILEEEESMLNINWTFDMFPMHVPNTLCSRIAVSFP